MPDGGVLVKGDGYVLYLKPTATRRFNGENVNAITSSTELTDYKFMCFNGRVECIFTCTERYSADGLKVTFFDKDWNVLPFERHYHKSSKVISRPLLFSKMIKLAEQLSGGIPFVRVDFYEIDGKIYFGELTFFPGSGFEEFRPDEWDYKIGEWLRLPIIQ